MSRCPETLVLCTSHEGSEHRFCRIVAGVYTPVFAKRVPVIPVGPRQGAPLRRCERCEDESPRKLSLNVSYSMAGG